MRKLLIIIAITLALTPGAPAQFSSVSILNPLAITTDTKDVPQSKVWFYDDRYWAVLTNKEGTHVWRLDNRSWTNVLTIGISEYARADCKVDGNLVHIFLYRKSRSFLVSLEYVPENYTYRFWEQRPNRVLILLPPAAETGTIDLDTKGRMWLAYDDSTSIAVKWSDPPYYSWSEPITLATGIAKDDIAAVTALPVFGKIGILWSNQNTQRFGFRLHTDGTAPEQWSADELPASQSALDNHGGMANDHLNMVMARDGTLYCAVKTGYRKSGHPKIALLIRRPSGKWDNLHQVSETGTRGIALLNETSGKIRIAYTADEDGGDILYRESGIDKIEFGPHYMLLNGKYNHCTSVKNNTSPHVLLLVSDSLVTKGVIASDATYLQLEASPNPSHAESRISFSVPGNTVYTLNLYSLTGHLLTTLKQGRTRYGEKHSYNLETRQLQYGMYILRLETEKRTKSIKLICL